MLGILTLGFRHGFDVDHVTAITDISGGQLGRLRAFTFATLYALGHAAMVAALGLSIAWAGFDVPDAGRLVGLTLVVLGGYVLWCAVVDRRPVSRAGMVAAAMTQIRDRVRPRTSVEHEHDHQHGVSDLRHQHSHEELLTLAVERAAAGKGEATTTTSHRHRHRHEDIPAPFGAAGAVGVGLIHGIGAETPTQVLALAAGPAALVPFLAGLVLANTVVAAIAVAGLTDRRVRWLRALVGAVSVGVGLSYLIGG